MNRTGDDVWWTFAPSISNATLTKTWAVKHVTSTQSTSTTCGYDGSDIFGPPAICTEVYAGTLAGQTVATPQAMTATPTVRLFDLGSTPPSEVQICPGCEPLEFRLEAGKSYLAVVGLRHLQPLGFMAVTSGYFEGLTAGVNTTRLPNATLSPSGPGGDSYCSSWVPLSATTARCTQITNVAGVRYAAALGFAAQSVATGAAAAAGPALTFKRSGTQVLDAPAVNNFSWSTTENPVP
ncbi:MAG: hypothetical protein HS111_28780 [Kofleriaceae bacterium]|nr:hypothetical protein [Kofleriaceae bacterium]